jgi:hypothetical protein
LARSAEINAVDGTEAVGQRLGDTVDEHLDAANAELTAGAKAAHRQA